MSYELTKQLFSLVIRGTTGLYEKITPMWLAKNDLINTNDVVNCRIDVIGNNIIAYNFEWASIRMLDDSLQILTDRSTTEQAKDLLFNWLSTIDEFPARAMGINFIYDYTFQNKDEWNRFGHTIAPKDPWGESFHDSGLMELTLLKRRETPPGYIQVETKSASSAEEEAHNIYKIRFSVNNHYEDPVQSSKGMAIILKDYFDKNNKDSHNLINKAIKRCLS